MRRTIAFFSVFFLVLLPVFSQAKDDKELHVVVTAESANVRAKPQSSAAVVAKVPNGEDLLVLDKNADGWYRVRSSKGIEGWIYGELVREVVVKEPSTIIQITPGSQYRNGQFNLYLSGGYEVMTIQDVLVNNLVFAAHAEWIAGELNVASFPLDWGIMARINLGPIWGSAFGGTIASGIAFGFSPMISLHVGLGSVDFCTAYGLSLGGISIEQMSSFTFNIANFHALIVHFNKNLALFLESHGNGGLDAAAIGMLIKF